MTHANWTPLPKLVTTDSYAGFRPSAHQVALDRVAQHFSADGARRMDEAIEAMGYYEFHDAVRRGFLRIEIVDGDVNLAHVVQDPPSDVPKRSRVSFSPGVTV